MEAGGPEQRMSAARVQPETGRYRSESGESFVFDRSGARPLFRFETRNEVWALRANAARVFEAINALPGLSTTPVEATYLAWIDCRALIAERGIANAAAFFEAAGVGLSDGKDFGLPGFVRLKFGCPPARLEAGLERIRRAVIS